MPDTTLSLHIEKEKINNYTYGPKRNGQETNN